MKLTKSVVAFVMTVEKLEECCGQLYFWTFTFKNVMPDWWYPRHWNMFCKALGNLHGGFIPGVRVIEPHPGRDGRESHGLHYHAIMGVRINKHLVARIAHRYGIGIFSVKKCDKHTAWYLAKYLSKNEAIHKGMRRWGMMGGFQGVKKNNIVVDSQFHRNMAEIFRGKKVTCPMTTAVWARTKLFGPVSQWPAGMVSEVIVSQGYAPIERKSFIIEKRKSGPQAEKILKTG